MDTSLVVKVGSGMSRVSGLRVYVVSCLTALSPSAFHCLQQSHKKSRSVGNYNDNEAHQKLAHSSAQAHSFRVQGFGVFAFQRKNRKPSFCLVKCVC